MTRVGDPDPNPAFHFNADESPGLTGFYFEALKLLNFYSLMRLDPDFKKNADPQTWL
jgi:hypothetical protein